MIVGIAGFMNSGKSTLAKIFEEHGFIRMSCADILKDIVSLLFSLPRDLLQGDTEEGRDWRSMPLEHLQWLAGNGVFKDDTVITPRLVLQRIGTDLFRNHVHEDIWLTLIRMKASSMEMNIIIDDTRFVNELRLCDYTINIVRQRYPSEMILDMHQSETDHLNHTYDYHIDNSGSIDDLIKNVETKILPYLV